MESNLIRRRDVEDPLVLFDFSQATASEDETNTQVFVTCHAKVKREGGEERARRRMRAEFFQVHSPFPSSDNKWVS